MPPWNISSPAKMKNGMASRENTLTPETMRWKATSSGSPSNQNRAHRRHAERKGNGHPDHDA